MQKKNNDYSIPHPVISTVTHGTSAECVQWRNPYRRKKNNDYSIPHPVISTVTHGESAECVQWRNLYRLFMNVEIPPLRMLRCRFAYFGRNDGGRIRHYASKVIIHRNVS